MTPCPTESPAEAGTLTREVDGLCAFDTLAIQLQIHANDTVERRTLSRRFGMPAQLTAMLLLEGEIRVSINRTSCLMSARNGPVGYLWLLSAPGSLVRHIQAGQRVRKVNVTVPLASLEGLRLPAPLRDQLSLDGPRPGIASWAPSAHALRCAQEILDRRDHPDGLQSLQAGIAGLSMLQQALQACHQPPRPPAAAAAAALRDRDVARARRIRERLLQGRLRQLVAPQQLAQDLGMSVSTLQRLFKAAYGTSVMEFQRTERLKAARARLLAGGLTVGEVGYRAGYSTLSNFSTAFQRAFGYPPSACVRR